MSSSSFLANYNNIFQVERIRNEQTINTNRWSLQFKGLKNILARAENHPLQAIRDRYQATKIAMQRNNIDVDLSVETILEIALFSVSLPTITLEIEDISRFNDSIKAVQKFSPMEEMQITFWDYVDGSASAIMQMWQALVGDKVTGAIGFKQDFVLPQAYFYVYGPDAPGYTGEDIEEYDSSMLDDGNIPFLQKYEVWNLFPNSVDLGEHSDSAEARKVSCNFTIDNIFPVKIQSYGANHKYIDDRQAK